MRLGKIRVYSLAKDLGIDSRLLLPVLAGLGVKVSSHASSIDEEVAEKVRLVVQQAQKQRQTAAKAATAPATATAEAPAAEATPEAAEPSERERELSPEEIALAAVGGPELLTTGAPPKGKRAKDEPEAEPEELPEEEPEVLGEPEPVLVVEEPTVEAEAVPAEQEVEEVKPPTRLRAQHGDRPPHAIDVPPVVTVMGHVDHGKTTLLDAIRDTNVTSTESGGITQHIGASEIIYNSHPIVFLDTPGHEAFTAMRARGASVTDLAVLVVAADDGVMPQTIEAINHATAAEVPIIVAITKTDLPEANPDRVKQQLAERNLVPEEWGGDTIMVNVSSVTREGLDNLLEMILLVAEVQELWADPDADLAGVVVESKLDSSRGPLATVLVRNGKLSVGDPVVCGIACGRVRQMIDSHGEKVQCAMPGVPVEVVGLSNVPDAGDLVEKPKSLKQARAICAERQAALRERRQAVTDQVTLEQLFDQMQQVPARELNLVLKGDVWGSVEALAQSLEGLNQHYEDVQLNVLHSGVGPINDSDVLLARASNAVVVGFHVGIDEAAARGAEEAGVDVRTYDVIYHAVNDISAAMAGLLEPEQRERAIGQAEVRALFRASRVGVIAGCFVTEGVLQRGAQLRVRRGDEVIYTGVLSSLRRFQDDVTEVEAGFECGVSLQDFDDFQEGDTLEAFVIEEVRRQPVTTQTAARSTGQ